MGNMRFKVGDRVRIKSLDWYNENKDEDGIVELSTHIFTPGMSQFCGKVVTIEDVFEDIDDSGVYYMEEIDYDWTDEMIEGLVKEEAKPKFKVGDRVITDTNMKGKIIEVVEEGWYRVEFEPYNGIPQPNGVVPEESMSQVEEECNYIQVDNIPDALPCKVSSACSHNGFYGYSDSEGNETSEWNLPDGYIFKDENGNVINATKIVLEKKKKEYPKTYEECYKIMGVKLSDCYIQGYKSPLLEDLQELLICRDAYWKIAGEEMGLGKPWKPDWENDEIVKYCIIVDSGIISKQIFHNYQFILAFPTEEMRDVFYENFKSEIEQCKELL